jgi:hypothetical protein
MRIVDSLEKLPHKIGSSVPSKTFFNLRYTPTTREEKLLLNKLVALNLNIFIEENEKLSMRGTNHEQDSRIKDKGKHLLQTTKFPRILSEKVDIGKVNLDVMRPWFDYANKGYQIN